MQTSTLCRPQLGQVLTHQGDADIVRLLPKLVVQPRSDQPFHPGAAPAPLLDARAHSRSRTSLKLAVPSFSVDPLGSETSP